MLLATPALALASASRDPAPARTTVAGRASPAPRTAGRALVSATTTPVETGYAATSTDVVQAVHRQVLERAADPAAAAALAGALDAGSTVRALVGHLAQSQEYHQRFINPVDEHTALTLLYRHLNAREPDAQAWGWIDYARAHGWNAVIQQMLSSAEYADHFGDHAVPGRPVVVWDNRRPGLVLEPGTSHTDVQRGMCLTAAVPGGAYQCGDLQVAYPLPGVRTLNRLHTPTLVYNSQHANPQPVFGARVMLPSAADRVEAVLRVSRNGGAAVQRATRSWSGTGFPAGQARRIAIGYDASADEQGVYDYTLEVTAFSGTQSQSWKMQGRRALVNRRMSPFGAGWWLAGLEELQTAGPDLLWIGGDGSTRLYQPLAGRTDAWVAQTFDRGPDTLRAVSDYPGARYMRRLPSGVRVFYDAAGQHIATVNRLDHHTRFLYDAQGKMEGLVIPTAAGYNGHKAIYYFGYGESTSPRGRLYRVSVPTLIPGTQAGTVTMQPQDGNHRITQFHGLDGTFDEYQYEGTTSRIVRHLDRNHRGTSYGYDPAGRLVMASRDMEAGVADDVVLRFTPAETRVLWDAPWAPESPDAAIDGARDEPGVYDHSLFWMDRFGGPRRARTPLHEETMVTRGDLRFPGLATRVDAPGAHGARMVSTAEYDDLGRVVRSTSQNPLGDGHDAVAQVAYEDPNWPRQPTRSTDPMGVVSITRYDPQTGQPVWKQTGPDPARGVRFSYNALSEAHGPGLLNAVRSEAAAAPERYSYTVHGNLNGVTSPGGVTTLHGIDERGRPTAVSVPVGNGQSQTTTTTYDAAGRVKETMTESPAVAFTRTGTYNGVTTPAVAPAQKLWVRNGYDNEGNLLWTARWSDPDEAGAGEIATWWEYDALGRRTKETVRHFDNAQDGRAEHDPARSELVSETTVYDKAGNVVQLYRRGQGQPIVMQYDVLNRLRRRTVPAVTFPGETVIVEQNAKTERYRRWAFPLFSASGGGNHSAPNHPDYPQGVVIPEEVSEFDYDAVGHLREARNGDAHVEREYFPNGALKNETQRIRNYADGAFSHVYRMDYRYDLNGRRTELLMPQALTNDVPWMRSTAYGYDAATGALAQVGGQDYGADFAYNNEGQVASVAIRAGAAQVLEDVLYDVEGRVREQTRSRNTGLVHHDVFQYDVRGKMLRSHTLGDSTVNAYSGMGALVWSYTDPYTSQSGTEETYFHDALGNRYRTAQVFLNEKTELVQRDSMGQNYAPGTGEMLRSGSQQEWDNNFRPFQTPFYDRAGNQVRFTARRLMAYPGLSEEHARVYEDTRSWFGADGKLRVIDRRTCAFGGVPEPGSFVGNEFTNFRLDCAPTSYDSRAAFEEHRYDALGRRVLTRTSHAWACELYCVNAVTRTVWDGDQIVAEIRAPLNNPERDSGVPPQGEVDVIDQPLYGRVLYRHGGGLDKPLMLVRLDYDETHTAPQVVIPHTNALGSYDGGTFASTLNGTGPCVTIPIIEKEEKPRTTDPYGNGSGGHGTHQPTAPGTVRHCVEVQWPARYLTRTHQSPQLPTARSWTGSLILNKRDASGQPVHAQPLLRPAVRPLHPAGSHRPRGRAQCLRVRGWRSGELL